MSGPLAPTAPPAVVRLRPRVRATPTDTGIHVRGWTTAFTVDGGRDLWQLWQRLSPVLRTGIPDDALHGLTARPGPWRAAARLVEALAAHDLLAAGPPDTAVTDWLDEAASAPKQARRLLAAAGATVLGEGPVAAAARSTFAIAGIDATGGPGVGDPRLVVLRADGSDLLPAPTIVAAAGRERGFVTHPAMRRPVSVAGRLANRLGITTAAPPALSAAAVGAAAAHRLMCGIVGLSLDRRGAGDAAGTWPTVLITTSDPVSVSHHPWVLDGPGRAGQRAEAEGLDHWLHILDALCDEHLGVLAAPDTHSLPQVPAGLAICGASLGVGVSPAAARLDAAMRAAERLLDPRGRQAVGTNSTHADGVLLRRAVFDTIGRRAVAENDDDRSWMSEPHARRWWTSLTRRFGVPAHCAVARLADGVHVARVETDGLELGWAVEAEAASAARSALFLATARHQARCAGVPADDAPLTVCGAAVWSAGRFGTERASVNPATAEVTEERLQRSMRRLVSSARYPEPVSGLCSGDLPAGLAGCGLVIRGWGGSRD